MSLKVYYLDDEEGLCENFSDAFSTEKFCVITFTDPAKAVEAAKLNPPDLFFLDYRLPGTTGDQIAQALDPKIPKFLITGDIFIETNYKFMKVFAKPYSDEEILKVLHEYGSILKAAG